MLNISDLSNGIHYLDGGMGSMLQARGLEAGDSPVEWNITHPDELTAVHREYIEAGSRFILTNTFGCNDIKMETKDIERYAYAAVENARRAVKESGKADVMIGFDIGPTGKLMEPLGDLSFDDAFECFAHAARCAVEAGADYIHIETMTDIYETKAALLAVRETTDLPVFVSVAFDIGGKLLTGSDVRTVTAVLEGLGADAIGINCGLGPEQALPLVRDFRKYTDLPIIVKPNAGLPEIKNGETVYNVDPDSFAEMMKRIVEAGGCLLGGCCGTTPEYIAALVRKTRGMTPGEPEEDLRNETVVTSYSRAVVFEGSPIVIGESINPSGRNELKAALADNDIDYVLRMAADQEEAGSHILDVNVGYPGVDEPLMMDTVVRSIQEVSSIPLQIDTVNVKALDRALRHYNGKPLINSVNGKQESMDAVLPLVAKYGGAVIALTLDENGIPSTAEGRAEIAGRIINEAAKYGIKAKDIIVDALTLTISSDPDAALTTIEAIKLIKAGYGVRTSLGVSNVSFGLPEREIVNSVFYSQALSAGLDAAIMNSMSRDMMNVYYAHNALHAQDLHCEEYTKYAAALPERTAVADNTGSVTSAARNKDVSNSVADEDSEKTVFASLRDVIFKGLKGDAVTITQEILADHEPMEVINECVIPALDSIGRDYEAGEIFLPRLISGAEAAQAACAVIKSSMNSASDESIEDEGKKVVLCTVKDDIHDIGKNIVKILMENYGFDVIDLGKDVDPETVVEAVRTSGASFVGLSALMTTTVINMEETVKKLKDAELDCRIAVGGAVVTQEYADTIGADFYCEDAMQTVRAARRVYE